MVQIIHYFTSRKTNIAKYYQKIEDYLEKKKKKDSKINVNVDKKSEGSTTKLNKRVKRESIKNSFYRDNEVIKYVSFLGTTRREDLWCFGGFFYNIRFVKLEEIKYFLLFHGACDVLLSDKVFLKNLSVFFSFFDRESFLLFFMKYVNIYDLYFIFSTKNITYFHMYAIVNQFNFRLKSLTKLFIFKKLWYKINNKFTENDLKKIDYYLFLYNLRFFNKYAVPKTKIYDIKVKKMLVNLDFFINKCSRTLINSLLSLMDYKIDYNNTVLTFYNYYNINNNINTKKVNINKYLLFNLNNFSYIIIKILESLNFYFFDLLLIFFFEFTVLIKIFFFKIYKFFNLYLYKYKNNINIFSKIFNFFLNKLYIKYNLKFKSFLDLIYNFNKNITLNLKLKKNLTIFFNFLYFFNKIFCVCFFFFDLKSFLKKILLIKYIIFNLFYLFLYYFFLSNCVFFELLENNSFFIQITLKNFIFKKSFFDFNKYLLLNNFTSLYKKQSVINYSEDYNFIYMNFINRFVHKKIVKNIFYRNINVFLKKYYYYLFRYIYINDNLNFFNKFEFIKYITKRTIYYYFKYEDIKKESLFKKMELFFYKINWNFKYNLMYPYYYIVYNVIGLQNYFYLPIKYRVSSNIEEFFSLVNFQNFSEYYEDDTDELFLEDFEIFQHSKLNEKLADDEEDEIDLVNIDFEEYEEDDMFALFFVEDINSLSYYTTTMYNSKFGMNDFINEDKFKYDNLFLKLKKKEKNQKNYLNNYSEVIKYYSFFFFYMNKYIFFDKAIYDYTDSLDEGEDFFTNFYNFYKFEDFFLGKFSKFEDITEQNLYDSEIQDFMDITAFTIVRNIVKPSVKHSQISFKYFPYILDLNWWWEFWFVVNYNIKEEGQTKEELDQAKLRLENLKQNDKYFNLLIELVEYYKENRFFFLENIKLYENEHIDDFFNETVKFLLDKIFITNMKKNIFLYYKSKKGFEYFLFNFFSFLTLFFLYYKKFENIVFFDFLSTHFDYTSRIKEYNPKEELELEDGFMNLTVDVKDSESYNLLFDNFYKKEFSEIRPDLETFYAEQQEFLVEEGLSKDLADDKINIRDFINNWYLKDRYLYLGSYESVLLQGDKKNINTYLYKKVKSKDIYNFLDVTDNFYNTYKINFNISSSELYLSEIYFNYIRTYTPKEEMDEFFNFYEDYNFKFYYPVTYSQDLEYERINDLKLAEAKGLVFEYTPNFYETYYKNAAMETKTNFEIMNTMNRFDNIFFMFNKIALIDYKIGERLDKYILRINSLKFKSSFDFISFEDYNLYSPFFYFLNKKKDLRNYFIENKSYTNYYFYFIFTVYLNKKLINVKNNLIKKLSFLYFIFFFRFYVYKQNKNIIFSWLLLLHFIVYKYILNNLLNNFNYGLFFIFFPIIFFFFFIKNLKLLGFDYTIINVNKEDFVKLLIKLILTKGMKEQIEFFNNFFYDIKLFFYLFVKSCYSYKYLNLFYKKYYKIIKIGFFYNFFFLLFLLFYFFYKEFNLVNMDLYKIESKLKAGYIYHNLYNLNINNSLRNYVSTLLIYYTDEDYFFSKMNEIDYMQWITNSLKKIKKINNIELEKDDIYLIKSKFKNLLKNYKKDVIYNIYFFKQFDLNLIGTDFFDNDGRGIKFRSNYDSTFFIDSELVDNVDFDFETEWTQFDFDDVGSEEDISDLRIVADDTYDDDLEFDDWEGVDTVDDETDEVSTESDETFDGEDFDYELDMDMSAYTIHDTTNSEFEEILDNQFDPIERYERGNGFHLQKLFPSLRFKFILDMIYSRYLEIIRNLLIRFTYFNKKNYKKRYYKKKNLKLIDRKDILDVDYYDFISKDIENVLKCSNSFFEINKSMLSRMYEDEFFDVMDYFMEMDTDISEFGYSYKNIDVGLGLPISNLHEDSIKSKKMISMKDNNNFRLAQVQDIQILNFNLLLTEKIKQRRFLYLLHEFDYLNVLNNKDRKKINLIFFFEYFNVYLKKVIIFLYKGFFNKNYDYIGLPLNLSNDLFKYIYRKVYIYLKKKLNIFLIFKKIYKLIETKEKKIYIIKKIIEKYKFKNNYDIESLIYFFDYFFFLNLPIYSFEDFFLRIDRLLVFFKYFNYKLTFLGFFFLDDFFFWFSSYYPFLNNKQYWSVLLEMKKIIINEEYFIFKNKYDLYQIYYKYGISETLFFFNNKLLYLNLNNRLNQVPFIYKFYFFLQDYFIFFFITVILFSFLLSDFQDQNSDNYLFEMFDWSSKDPLENLEIEDEEMPGDFIFFPEHTVDDYITAGLSDYFFDGWGLF